MTLHTVSTSDDPVFDAMPVGERQDVLKNIFIEHDRYQAAYEFLRRAHYPVEGGRPDYGSISCLFGESRAGKSSVASKYERSFEPQIGEAGVICPVRRVNISTGGEKAFLHHIADALDLPYTSRLAYHPLLKSIMRALTNLKVELLVLDEANTIANENNARGVPKFLNVLRKLVDHCRLNIVCIGLENTYGLLVKDPQITGRGLLPYHEVRPYSWASDEERKRFRLLCLKFDEHMPFNQRTGLERAWFAERLYLSSKEGIIGRLSEFLYRAGCRAINDGADAVETQHFAEAYEEIKKRGVDFNQWVNDLSQAPKSEKKVVDQPPREVFSKKRPPKVEV